MSREFNFESDPFRAFAEYGGPFEQSESESAAGWQGEVNRSTANYTRWVQSSLNKILGLRLAVDGVKGSQTNSAIRSFQQRSGLQVDGKVGPQTERALVAAGSGPPPADGSTSTPPGSPTSLTPGLVKREASPPSHTLYFDLSLGSESPARPMTGIFIPEGYRPQSQVDLILYLHGFKQRPALTIDGYWDKREFPYFSLREGLNEGRKNVILVAPTLGPRSQTGWLTRSGGFSKYLDQLMAALAASGPYKDIGQTPRPGNIILSCHSGGGWPMRELALSGELYTAQIKECWGFDCTYNRGDDTEWARWARSRPNAALYIYYIANTRTETLSLALQRQKAPNVFVTPSRAAGHNWVPITHWRERIAAANFLANL